jgi:hypothetical protein
MNSLCVDCRDGAQESPKLSTVPPASGELGTTMICLPFGGLASTDPEELRVPFLRPFWLLADGLSIAIAIFVWLRVNLF